MTDELFAGMYRGAVISDCGRYRYSLTRQWDRSRPCLPFIMLNPSTADAIQDDPTIRRCIGFGRRENYGGIIVVNVFAFRTQDPFYLREIPDPVGPLNHAYILNAARDAIRDSTPVICAWGSRHNTEATTIAFGIVQATGAATSCLGKTISGHPCHPLYLKASQPLEPYP